MTGQVADYASAALKAEDLKSVGYEYSTELDKWNMSDLACDFLYLGMNDLDFEIPGTLGIVNDYKHWKTVQKELSYPLYCADEYLDAEEKSAVLNFIVVNSDNLTGQLIEAVLDDTTVVFVLSTENMHGMAEQRRMIVKLMNKGSTAPVILKRSYKGVP